MMIDERLKSLVKYISKNDSVIDIGCDHALLDIYLIQNNIIDSVIVSDISSNALKQGINNIKKYNLDSRIDARCGNGLEVLNDKDNINTVIISGMGTNTILNILNNQYLNKINKLIIQSNKDYYLYSGSPIWTFSPATFKVINTHTYEWSIDGDGDLDWHYNIGRFNIRPVINLKADVKISSGDGTSIAPYKID